MLSNPVQEVFTALDAAAADGRLQPGQLVTANALGGGFAWGAAVLRW